MILFGKLLAFFNPKKSFRRDYVDLGSGFPWFVQYRASVASTLGDFFGLELDRSIQLTAVVDKFGYYQTPKGERWALFAIYFDKGKQLGFTFCCPELEYHQVNKYRNGDSLAVRVDKDDYSKYDMLIDCKN